VRPGLLRPLTSSGSSLDSLAWWSVHITTSLTHTHMMCSMLCMPTNLAIDDRLLEQALNVGGFRTKRETVNEALREFIRRRQRLELAKLAGRIEYDPRYDYKRERRSR